MSSCPFAVAFHWSFGLEERGAGINLDVEADICCLGLLRYDLHHVVADITLATRKLV